MAKDWVPCFGYGVAAGVDIVGSTAFTIPLVGTGLGVDPAGNQVGVPDTDPEEVLVHRTVGQVRFRNISIENIELVVSVRFTTALFNQDFGALFPFTTDLDSGADANEGFMNERRFNLSIPGTSNFDLAWDPKWSHWDITTKRKLRSAEWTCLVVNVGTIGGQGGAGFMTFQHFLRSWVTTSN